MTCPRKPCFRDVDAAISSGQSTEIDLHKHVVTFYIIHGSNVVHSEAVPSHPGLSCDRILETTRNYRCPLLIVVFEINRLTRHAPIEPDRYPLFYAHLERRTKCKIENPKEIYQPSPRCYVDPGIKCKPYLS